LERFLIQIKEGKETIGSGRSKCLRMSIVLEVMAALVANLSLYFNYLWISKIHT